MHGNAQPDGRPLGGSEVWSSMCNRGEQLNKILTP